MNGPEIEFGRMPAEQIVPCCSSAVYSGGDRCDCWEVELASPQQPVVAIRNAHYTAQGRGFAPLIRSLASRGIRLVRVEPEPEQ